MKKLLTSILATLSFLFPAIAHGQVMNQNQVVFPPYINSGIIFATSSAGNSKLTSISTSTLYSVLKIAERQNWYVDSDGNLAPTSTIDVKTTQDFLLDWQGALRSKDSGGVLRQLITIGGSDQVEIGTGVSDVNIMGTALIIPVTGGTLYANGSGLVSAQTGTQGICTEWGANGTIVDAASGLPCGAGGSGAVYIASSSPFTIGDLAFVSSNGTISSVATGTLSESVTGLQLSAARALVGGSADLSLTAGYNIPLTASTTLWESFYQTPSTRITAGTNLSWSGNTLNNTFSISTSSINYWVVGSGFLRTATTTDGARAAFFTATSTTASSTFASAVGIGIQNPDSPLTISSAGMTTAIVAPQAGTLIHLASSGSGNARITGDVYTNGTTQGFVFQGRKARGGVGSPAPVNADDTLAAFGGVGYGTTGFPSISAGAYVIRAEGAGSDTSQPTYLSLFTTATGTITPLERVRVTSTGRMGIASTTPVATLGIQSTAGALAFAISSTTGSSTFGIDADGSVWVSGDSGTQGQVFISRGPLLPPAWSPISALLTNLNTNPFTATYFAATSTTATSTFGRAMVIGSTTVPASVPAELQIYNNNLAGASPAIVIGGNNGGDTDFWIGRVNDNDSTNDDSLQIGTSTTPGLNSLLTLNFNGGLGIGTTSPSEVLTVAGGAYFAGNFTGSNLIATGTAIVRGNMVVGTSTNSGARFAVQGVFGSTLPIFDIATTTSLSSATSSLLRVNINGNVGLGTSTPDAKLSIHATNLANTAYILNIATSTSGGNATSSVLSILANGNIGVASTSPDMALSVSAGKAIHVGEYTITPTSTVQAIDFRLGNKQRMVIGGNAVAISVVATSTFPGANVLLTICNSNFTGGAVTFTGVKWPGGTAGTHPTTAGACSSFNMVALTGSTTPFVGVTAVSDWK